eukprot:gene4276-14695_t
MTDNTGTARYVGKSDLDTLASPVAEHIRLAWSQPELDSS